MLRYFYYNLDLSSSHVLNTRRQLPPAPPPHRAAAVGRVGSGPVLSRPKGPLVRCGEGWA